MFRYCQNCNLKVPLISKSRTGEEICPVCRNSSNIRTAQYGGMGSGGNLSFSPGGSPMSNSSPGGGKGINRQVADESLDTIMSKTHHDAPIDENRNWEVRLQPFHAYSEKDTIPYDLTLEERHKLRIKEQIYRREQLYKQVADSIHDNSVSAIQNNPKLKPTPQQMHTLEQSLEPRHYEPSNRERDPREDESPAQDKPTRIHPVMSNLFLPLPQRFATDTLGRGTNRMVGDNDDPESEESWMSHQKYTTPPLGRTPILEHGDDLDQYFKDMSNENWGGTGPNTTTLIDYYPQPDQIGDHFGPKDEGLPSPIEDRQDAHSTSRSLEQGLEKVRKDKLKQRLPSDPYNGFDLSKLMGNEPNSPASKYPVFEPDHSNAQLPSMGGFS